MITMLLSWSTGKKRHVARQELVHSGHDADVPEVEMVVGVPFSRSTISACHALFHGICRHELYNRVLTCYELLQPLCSAQGSQRIQTIRSRNQECSGKTTQEIIVITKHLWNVKRYHKTKLTHGLEVVCKLTNLC